MATEDIVGGLFGVNPAMYQQQQQQQVFNRAVALQNLDPFQQAAVGYQQAGYNLAGALGGAMGGVDPQLQRISALNAISKQIDQSNPESMMNGAKMLADAGFMQEALGLANYARKANSEIALAQQRQKEGAVASTDAIKNATALADASGFTKGTPAYNNAYKEALTAQTAKPGKTDSIFANINPSDYTPESVKLFVVSKNYGDLVAKVVKADSSVSAINPSDYTPASLAAFKLSNNYADLVPKAAKTDSLVSAINPNDFTPASLAAFKLSSNYADLVPKAAKTDNLISAVNPNDYTPASIAAFKLSSNYVDLVLRPEKTAAADKANIKEIGVSAKGDAVYLDVNKDEQFTFKIEDGKTVRVPYAGTVDRTTSKVSASATATGAKQEAAFETGLGTGQSKRVIESQEKAQAAADILATNEVGRSLLNSGAITGAGADFFVGLNKALKQAGIDFGYADAASNSQAYAAAMAANAGQLIKQFGAGTGLSDVDREYATKAAAGQISMDETAIRKVLDINDRAARNIIKRHNQSVKGIKTNIPLEVEIPTAPPPPALSGAAAIPTGKPAATATPMYATNGKQRIMSTDGGKTWSPVR